MDIRIGHGFDVHAFEEGNFVILGGVKISPTSKLRGHSDADVLLHAITDAIFGALAEGDIGTHFPPDDVTWKDAPSEIFLKYAVKLAKIGSEIIGGKGGGGRPDFAQAGGDDVSKIQDAIEKIKSLI